MEANGHPLRFLCDEAVLEIPFFQRPYVWNDDNWEDLLKDLINTSGSHFLGSIILKRAVRVTGEANRAIVIDGQQRLTTLSILIKALYDSINNKDGITSDAIAALFYKLRSSDTDYCLSIEHSHNDHEQFEEVIGNVVGGKIQSPIINNLAASSKNDARLLIKRCYKYFYEELQKRTQDEMTNLWDSLFDRNNKILVVIDLDDNDQEQKIFDTINSAGIRLTSTDIIKNALYQRLIELTGDREEIAHCYKDTWEEVFEKDDDAMAYWAAEKSIGRLMRQNSELLLQTVAIIEGIFDVEKHTIQQLADLYKARIDECDEGQLTDFISKIMSYAEIYKNHIPDFDGTEYFEYSDTELEQVERRVSFILAKNDISTFNPYIVYIFKEYAGNEALIIERLMEIEKYVMGHLITKESIKNFNKDCTTFINDKAGTEIKSRLQEFTASRLKAGIANVSNKIAAVILFWIELRRRGLDGNYGEKALKYNYQLEHIMPQKWEEHWGPQLVPYVDENGNALPDDDDSKKKREAKIYSLGNMTLLSGKLNASISNNSFQQKMEGEGRRKGVVTYSSLSIAQDDLVSRIYNQGRIWNEQAIAERENYLGNEVADMWSNP